MNNPNMENVLASTSLEVPNSDGRTIQISFEMVTPEIAQQWLETNSDSQRKLNRSLVRQFASQMKKGLWRGDNGESIKFSEKGLIDGQHRLTTIAEGEDPCMLMIMRGIDDSLINRLDVGKKRSLSDIFRVNGFTIPKGMTEMMLSSIVLGIYTAKEYMSEERPYSKSVRIDSNLKTKPSPVELYEFVTANPMIMKRLSKLDDFKLPTIAKNVPVASSIVGWFLVDIIDSKVAEEILMTMQECVPQSAQGKQSPSFKLFQYIQRCRMKKVPINKNEMPGLFLWAADLTILEREPVKVLVQSSHMPGQGHEGSEKLKKYFKKLKDFKK